MPEVPEHLVPSDGLTNSQIKLDGLDLDEGGAVDARFGIYDEDGQYIGTFTIRSTPTQAGTTDDLIATAYRRMTDVLRQWLYVTDIVRQVYEKRGA